MKNAVIYTRHSMEQIDKQASACNEYAKANNFHVVKVYQDYNKKRPQWQKIMQDAKENNFDCVICYSCDRITRNFKDLIKYRSILNKYGVDLCFTNSTHDYLDILQFIDKRA